MAWKRSIWVWLPVVALLSVGSVAAAEAELRAPEDWRETAKRHGFGPGDIARLERDKLLVSGETFRQVFVPYLGSSLPVFVTSDSLLNAFHVLFEESVRRLEEVNAGKLPPILRRIRDHLDGVTGKIRGRRPDADGE